MSNPHRLARIASLALALASPSGLLSAQETDLAAALQRGRWTAEAEAQLSDAILAEARAAAESKVPESFWPWLDAQPALRGLVVQAAAAHGLSTKGFACLARLVEAAADDVARHPELAVGFALAWSGGEGDEPARRWGSWTGGRAPIPTMVESFRWYVAQQRRLLTPLRGTPFQLLAMVALNDVPLEERAWVLERYRGRDLDQLHDIFAEVPYIHGGLDGKAESLPNMVEHGGVCTVNTQYQMAALRTLGVPTVYAGGPGHCWPCWIGVRGRRFAFDRTNDLGNADGTLGEWGTEGPVFESDLKLLAAALQAGVERVRDAELCAAAVWRLGAQAAPGAWQAVQRVLERSPLAERAWVLVAGAVAAGHADADRAPQLLAASARALGECPEAALRVFRRFALLDGGVAYGPDFVAAVEQVGARLAKHDSVGERARRIVVEHLERSGAAERAGSLRYQRLAVETVREVTVPDEHGLCRTRILGGGGGSAFEDVARDGEVLRGFRYTLSEYAGHRVVGSIQPVFVDAAGARRVGAVHGEPRGEVQEVLLPDGGILVGIEARGGDRFDGFRLVSATGFDREGGPLEPRFSAWAGGAGDGWGTLLEVRGAAAVGIAGRAGAQLDALGLVGRTER